MKLEKIILDFVKSKKKNVDIIRIAGLLKTGENEWSFRYTYRDGDFLSISKLFKVKLEGYKKIPSFITTKRLSKSKKSKKTA